MLLMLLSAAFVSVLAEAGSKEKKPSLEMRSAPRFGFSPVNVLITAELKGGDDVEDYYCPELEWVWDDGGKSVTEADCPPFEQGVTKIDRRFTAEHEFKRSGVFTVQLSLTKADRLIARQTVAVTVRPGLNDPTLNGMQ
jgi:hypothetical protein